MATRIISTKMAIEGEEEYRRSLGNINSALAAMKAELANVKAEHRDSANSMDALRAKSEALSRVQEQLSAKIKAAAEGLENAQKVQQSYAARVEEARARVTQAEAALEKLRSTSGASAKAQEELSAALASYREELQAAQRYQEAAQRGVSDWQKELANAKRALTDTNRAIQANDQYLEEATRSADGCAASIDRFGKRVKTAGTEAEQAAEKTDTLAQSLETAAGRLDSAGNKLTVGLTTPLVAAGTAAFQYASDAQEAANKVDVAFGNSAEAVKAWSSQTLTSIGLASGTAQDMAALYGDMATSMGIGKQAAAEMSMELVNLAGDLASFKNESLEQVNTALKGVFTGETESLKELGVVMTQTQLEAYAMAKGYQAAYQEMDQAQQVALRFQYVLDATQNAQGDFARTSESAANQVRIFQESLKEAAASAGDDLLPIITPVIENLTGLVQEFTALDEGTQRAVVQTGLFVAALGPALKLTGGITTAVSAGVSAYQALTAAQTAAKAAQSGLNVAMAANPIGAVATAVGTLVAVLGAFGLTAALTAEKTDSLTQSVEASKRAYEEAVQAIQTEQADTVAMVTALERLVEQENKTTAQKDAILSLVNDLNEAVPNLSLAYDEQTDSLNMTTEALLAMAAAQAEMKLQQETVDNLSNAYKKRAEIAAQLAEAEAELTRAQAEQGDVAVDTTNKMAGLSSGGRVLSDAVRDAAIRVNELKWAQEENEAQIVRLEAECERLTQIQREGTVATQAATTAMESGADAASAIATQLSAVVSVVEETKGAFDLLSKAQAEQADSGYLSLDTAIQMINKYPELAGYLVQAANGYQLADGALENYIASQRSEYEIALNEAQRAADAIVQAEADKINAINATTATVETQLTALASLYQSMGAMVDSGKKLMAAFGGDTSSIDTSSYYQKAEEYRKAAQALADAKANLSTFDFVSASYFRTGGTGGSSGGRGSGTSGGRGGSAGETGTAGTRSEDPGQAAMDELEGWLADMEHRIFLWAKDESKAQAVVGLYQQMQEGVHALAEDFRSKGYSEESDEIQQLQKLWWDYSDEIGTLRQEMYDRDLTALQEALGAEQMTQEEYLSALQQLQDTYFQAGSRAWTEAEATRQAEANRLRQEETAKREAAYREQLADQQYFLDMELISEEEYYTELARLRDEYLEENSEAWRAANVALHNYLEERRQAELQAAQEAYEAQQEALEERQEALEAALKERQEALEAVLKEEQAALKEAYEEEQNTLKEQYSAQKEAARAAYEAKRDEIEAELALEKERLNGIIDAINEEIQARKELREDESQDDAIATARKRLEAAQAQLAYARTDEDRAEWEKEVIRRQEALDKAIRDKEDTLFYREKEEEKQAVQDQIDQAEAKAQADLKAAQAEYDALLNQMEADYQAQLAQAKAEYEAALERAQGEYEAALKRAQEEYEALLKRLEEGGNPVRSPSRIDREDSGVKKPGPHSIQPDTGSDNPVRQLAGMVAAAAGTVANVINSRSTSVTNNSRSASVTINSSSGLTEGQVARSVEKVLNRLGK